MHLPGLLLNHKGDRVAMANSVETRYPFLDEDVISLVSKLHPRWKLRGLTRDKYLLRQAAARLLPKEAAFRKKGMFRAPLAESFFVNPPAYVRQLMSPEALGAHRLLRYRRPCCATTTPSARARATTINTFLKMGLTGVLSTQLWHHLYMGGGLCELPEHSPRPQVERPPQQSPAAA